MKGTLFLEWLIRGISSYVLKFFLAMTCLCSDYFYNIYQASSNSSWGQVDRDVPFSTILWLNRVFLSTRYELATHLNFLCRAQWSDGKYCSTLRVDFEGDLKYFFLFPSNVTQVSAIKNKQTSNETQHIFPPYWYSSHSTELTNEIRKFRKLFELGHEDV